MADIDLLIIQEHTVDSLDGVFGRFIGFIVDETISLGTTVFIGSDLAGENVTESGKRVVESLSILVSRTIPLDQPRLNTLLSICSSRFLMKMLP